MMTKGVVVSAIIAVILSGCSVMNKTGIQTAPADFIIEQDTTDVVFEIGKLYNYDHQVIFKRNQYSLAESEKARLLDWLQATQPSMIGVRGTGGAQRHRDLGYKRASEIIGYLQSRQARGKCQSCRRDNQKRNAPARTTIGQAADSPAVIGRTA